MRFKFNVMGRAKKTIKSVFNQNTKSEVKKEVKKTKQEIIPFEEPIVKSSKEVEEVLEEKELVEQPLVEEVEEKVEEDVVVEEPKLRSFAELSSEQIRFFERTGILPQQ